MGGKAQLKVKSPLCFGQFVPSPFYEGVHFVDRSKGLLQTYISSGLTNYEIRHISK